MWELVKAIVVVTLSFAILLAFLGLLYWLTHFLPKRWQESWRAWVFLLPASIAMVVGLLIPALRTIYLSLFNDTSKNWVGFQNYLDIFQTRGTRLTVFNSIVWVTAGTAITIIIGLAVARYADGIRGEKVAKSAIFIPVAVSLVGAGLIWTFVYAGPPFDNGLLNAVTGAIPGLPNSMGGDGERLWYIERGFGPFHPPDWAPGFNTFLLVVIFIWAQAGFAMVIFSAAIRGVPDSLIEAAKVDGASNRQVFYKVTLPYIRGTIVTVTTLTMIAGLKAFDIVAATTGGHFDTSTIANEFYQTKFVQGRNGLGAALAVLIFVLVIPIVIMNRQAQKRAEEMMGA